MKLNGKKDTIYIAGDGGTPVLDDIIVSVKKIKNGNVSNFRKSYKKELKYHYSTEFDYSQNYLDELYLLIEYYVSNSNNELIQLAINNKNQIEYSIEEGELNNKKYEIIGIGKTFEGRFTIMQWLYIDRESNQIYEYDLPNEKLNSFN